MTYGGVDAPPPAACQIMAMICGLAIRAAVPATTAASRSRARRSGCIIRSGRGLAAGSVSGSGSVLRSGRVIRPNRDGRSASDGRTSHGIRTTTARIAASTADSWSVSRAAPRIAPRMAAWRRPGARRRRIAAARVSGRNSAPRPRFSWYQLRQVRLDDSPKKAPAAMAPNPVGSHSRAARYIA